MEEEIREKHEEHARLLKQALDSDQEILRIIGNMNLVLDIERRSMVLNRMPTSFVSLVRSVMGRFRSEHGQDGIRWEEEAVDGGIGPIDIDSEKLRVALDAVCDNAVRYGRTEGGLVSLKVVRYGSRLRCEITDNGIGIPQSEQPYVSDRFFRASNAQTKFPDGIGIGLYIAKSIIQAHGGEFGLTSIEGKGTTVWLTLPIVPDVQE
jgi:two-component system sensor histidine kinase VicK